MKTLGAIALLALMTGTAWAGTCRQGQTSASCANGTYNCCMPVGMTDCGDGRHAGSYSDCRRAQGGQSGTGSGSGATGGTTGQGSGTQQPCKSGQTFNYRGECADGMR